MLTKRKREDAQKGTSKGSDALEEAKASGRGHERGLKRRKVQDGEGDTAALAADVAAVVYALGGAGFLGRGNGKADLRNLLAVLLASDQGAARLKGSGRGSAR